MRLPARNLFGCVAFLSRCAVMTMLSLGSAIAAELELLHADSLAGPMRALKGAFEAKHAGVTVKLTSGVSRELARKILDGYPCDVFAPSSPAVIDEDLMNKRIVGSDKEATRVGYAR